MQRSSRLWVGIWILLYIPGTVAFAAPSTVAIQGTLTNANGQHLLGPRVWSLQYYDAATGGSALGAIQRGTVAVAPSGR
jgi:hypothetical protein